MAAAQPLKATLSPSRSSLSCVRGHVWCVRVPPNYCNITHYKGNKIRPFIHKASFQTCILMEIYLDFIHKNNRTCHSICQQSNSQCFSNYFTAYFLKRKSSVKHENNEFSGLKIKNRNPIFIFCVLSAPESSLNRFQSSHLVCTVWNNSVSDCTILNGSKLVFSSDSSICVTSTVVSNGILVVCWINLSASCLGEDNVSGGSSLSYPNNYLTDLSCSFPQTLIVLQDEFSLTLVVT